MWVVCVIWFPFCLNVLISRLEHIPHTVPLRWYVVCIDAFLFTRLVVLFTAPPVKVPFGETLPQMAVLSVNGMCE